MVLHLSVSHSVYRGVCLSTCWDTPPEQTPPSPPGPGTPSPPGADTPWDQAPPPDKAPPTSAVHAGRYGQQADGMHPTGKQSCMHIC